MREWQSSCPCDVLRALDRCPASWGSIERKVMTGWWQAQTGAESAPKPQTPRGRKLHAQLTRCRHSASLAALLGSTTEDSGGSVCTEADALAEEEVTAIVQAAERVLVRVFAAALPKELSEDLQRALVDHDASAKNRMIAELLVQTGRLLQAGLSVQELERLHADVVLLFADAPAGACKQ